MCKGGKPNKVVWTEGAAKSFEVLRMCLVKQPILRLPNTDLPFILQTDASDVGIGGVLLQESSGLLFPLHYASRKLLPRETRYSTIERECLAIVWAIQKFQVYLYGKQFVLQTDHKPLVYLHRSKVSNSRLMHWALQLQPYKFTIQAIKGSHNVGADYLSCNA